MAEVKSRTKTLPERQLDVLDTLAVYGDWARPMDIGARDGAHHSATLMALVRKGLAKRRLRGSLLNQIRGRECYEAWSKVKRGRSAPRGSYVYRITNAGRKLIDDKRSHSR
jgi:hypothetical protein